MSWFRVHRRGRPPHPDVLTPAEWRVLEQLRAGGTNAEVAERLGVSVNTVRAQVSSMLAKLDLDDREQLAAWQGEPAVASRDALARMRAVAPFGWLSSGVGRWMGRIAGGFAAVAVTVMFFIALSGGRQDAGTAMPTASPTAVATEPSASPTAVVALPTSLPAIVRRVVDSVQAKDADAVMALVRMQAVACRPDGAVEQSTLPCVGGDPAGTQYLVFSVAGCSGTWTRDPRPVLETMVARAGAPYAIAAIGPPPDWWEPLGNPVYGSFVVVFAPPDGAGITAAEAFYVSEDGIVRVQHGCRRADQFLRPGVDQPAFRVLWSASAR